MHQSSRKRGRPKLRYKDTLKASLKDCHIDPEETWEQSASDRPAWRHQVWKGANSYEKNRIAKKKEQRRKRKERESNFAHPPCSWLNPILTNPYLSCLNQLSSLSFFFIYHLVLTHHVNNIYVFIIRWIWTYRIMAFVITDGLIYIYSLANILIGFNHNPFAISNSYSDSLS